MSEVNILVLVQNVLIHWNCSCFWDSEPPTAPTVSVPSAECGAGGRGHVLERALVSVSHPAWQYISSDTAFHSPLHCLSLCSAWCWFICLLQLCLCCIPGQRAAESMWQSCSVGMSLHRERGEHFLETEMEKYWISLCFLPGFPSLLRADLSAAIAMFTACSFGGLIALQVCQGGLLSAVASRTKGPKAPWRLQMSRCQFCNLSQQPRLSGSSCCSLFGDIQVAKGREQRSD